MRIPRVCACGCGQMVHQTRPTGKLKMFATTDCRMRWKDVQRYAKTVPIIPGFELQNPIPEARCRVCQVALPKMGVCIPCRIDRALKSEGRKIARLAKQRKRFAAAQIDQAIPLETTD